LAPLVVSQLDQHALQAPCGIGRPPCTAVHVHQLQWPGLTSSLATKCSSVFACNCCWSIATCATKLSRSCCLTSGISFPASVPRNSFETFSPLAIACTAANTSSQDQCRCCAECSWQCSPACRHLSSRGQHDLLDIPAAAGGRSPRSVALTAPSAGSCGSNQLLAPLPHAPQQLYCDRHLGLNTEFTQTSSTNFPAG